MAALIVQPSPEKRESEGGKHFNKLASLESMLVPNSAHRPSDRVTGVKCRATSVAKKLTFVWQGCEVGRQYFLFCNAFDHKSNCKSFKIIWTTAQYVLEGVRLVWMAG